MPQRDEEPDLGFSGEKLTERGGDATLHVAPGGGSLLRTARPAPMSGPRKGKATPGTGGPKP